MPRYPNKVIINDFTFRGRAKAICAEFKAARFLSYEVIEVGGGSITNNAVLKEDGDLHLAEQVLLCSALDAALDTFLDGQRALTEQRRKWIDTKLDAPAPRNGKARKVNGARVSRKVVKK